MAATTNLPSSTGSGDLDNIAVTRAEFRAEIGVLLEYLAQALGDVGGDYTNEAVKPTEVKLQGTPIIEAGANPVTDSADQRIPSTKWVKESGTYVSDTAYSAPVDGQLWVDTSDTNYALKAYNSSLSPAAWQLVGGFPSGTKMLFQQTAAPTGWTKETSTIDNHALRVTTGTPGIVSGNQDFTDVFTTQTIDGTVAGHSLTEDEMPQHKHGITDGGHDHGSSASVVDNHTHTVGFTSKGNSSKGGGGNNEIVGGSTRTSSASSDISVTIPTGTTGIDVQNTGSGDAHTHGFDGTNLNLAVNYVDVIVATKD